MCRLMAFINIFTVKVMSCLQLYFQPYLKSMFGMHRMHKFFSWSQATFFRTLGAKK